MVREVRIPKMRMFVANLTHQNIDFQYRLPEIRSLRQQQIPIGGQIPISGNLSTKDIDMIIEIHEVYGLVKSTDISKFKGFHIPYIYSIGEPISAEIIAEGIVQNREYNNELGKRLRAEAAVAVNASIEEQTPDKLTNFEMTITEEPRKDRDVDFAEAIRVTRDIERGAPQDPTKTPLSVVPNKRSVF